MSNDTDYTTDKEYAYDFIKVLSKFKQVNENNFIFDKFIDNNKAVVLRSSQFNSFSIFKAIICELFYQAIQAIPHDITHYTITCTSNKGVSKVQLGVFDELDDDGEISIAKVMNPEFSVILNKEAVHNMYIANKSNFYNYEIVNTIMMLLYMDGYEPLIRTSFISVKGNTKF